jgi:hypothetical protein
VEPADFRRQAEVAQGRPPLHHAHLARSELGRLRDADGGGETLQLPRGNDVYGAYWDYRWWKWAEWIRQDAQEQLWKPAALWFARKAAVGGRQPIEVVLVRRWYDLFPPGPGPSRGPWQEHVFYTLSVTPPSEGAAG